MSADPAVYFSAVFTSLNLDAFLNANIIQGDLGTAVLAGLLVHCCYLTDM
jgi:predicted patatin/cPLA2 family phospholipase